MRKPLVLILGAGGVALAIALTAVTGGRLTSFTGHAGAVSTPPGEWWTMWALPPVEVVAIAILALVLAARVRRGPEEGRSRRMAFLLSGTGVLLVSVCAPIGGLAQGGLLSAHMVQHVLIGAVAPLLILLAVPRVMPDEPAPERFRRLRVLALPQIAFPLWVASTIVWLLPDVHHAVLTSQGLWVLQQVAFFAFGALLWCPVLERWIAAPEWFGTGAKCFYMVGVWFVGLGIANVYWFSGTAFYESHAVAAATWGINPLEDQAMSGTIMMLTHCAIALGAVTVLFFRQWREGALRQRLLEEGLDPASVHRALRRGELEDLARSAGVPVRLRAGID